MADWREEGKVRSEDVILDGGMVVVGGRISSLGTNHIGRGQQEVACFESPPLRGVPGSPWDLED